MIYAVNKKTKEHVAHPDKRMSEVSDGVVIAEDGWELVEADADGWIDHAGSENPLPRDFDEFEIRTRRGEEGRGLLGRWVWSRDYNSQQPFDIIAYRPIRDAEPNEPETPEWDWAGNGYAPPVGTECEGTWLEAPDGGSRDFETVLIKGRHKTGDGRVQVWFCTQQGEDIVMLESNCHFRPIRSEEDRAVEEMARLLADEFDAAANDCIDAARALYRAGYRKTGDE